MKRITRKKLCEDCLILIRKEEADDKRIYRIKIKEIKSKPEKVKVNGKVSWG